jgi:CTP:phosphocholine cytidylyltransferase-like protein/thiamine kinase-like enzyme
MKSIKKGLIFAAGKGTRLRPLTLSTPKPLIKINGTPMIETIISSMIANGIKKIYIVLGYKKEMFYYLKDKYFEVEFIENKDYETRNTISSLYAARNILNDDFIISEGDLWISDSSIFKAQIENSQYLYRPNQFQNSEWGFHLDFITNKILEIRKPDSSVYLNNNLYGVSFWLKDDLKAVVDEVVKEYDNPIYKDAAYDELINNIIGSLFLGVREVNNNQIVEVDSLDELFDVDPSYSIFKSIDLLKQVFGINRNDITAIYENPGRSTNNYNYVVEVKDEKYIVRIPGIGTELFSDRLNEKHAYLQLNGSGLIEQNYFIDHVTGVKISKYYPNSRIINANDETELKGLMKVLKKLHTSNYKFSDDNVFDRIRRYDSFVARFGGRKFYQKKFISLRKEVLKNEESFRKLFDVHPIHGDLSPNNAIVTEDGEILLIDLEFVSMGDPYTDLATFSHDGNYSPEQTIRLLELFLERKPTDQETYKLLTLCTLVSVMWYSWAVFKMTVEGPQGVIKFKPYRDLYLDYAIIMHNESKKYE